MTWILTAFGLLILFGSVTKALSANANVPGPRDQQLASFPVGAAVHLYRGAIVGKDPAGYVKAFVPGDVFVGISDGEYDNSSGAAGAINCTVYTQGDFVLPLTGVVQLDLFKPAYATADNATSLTGHPDGYVGRIMEVYASNYATIRLRGVKELAPNGQGSIVLELTGHEVFTATGATAGTACVGAFDLKSILGTGWVCNDAEDGGIKGDFDATAEIALCSCRTRNNCLPIDKGVTMELELCVADKGDAAAVDVDWGFGTALTANSEASIDHADMVQLAAFHLDGASDNVLAQSDDNTTDVAAVDTTIDNDSTTDVPKKYKIIVRPTGVVEYWGAGVRVLTTTSFAMLSTALVGAFVNMEKTSDDTTASIIIGKLRVAAGMAA